MAIEAYTAGVLDSSGHIGIEKSGDRYRVIIALSSQFSCIPILLQKTFDGAASLQKNGSWKWVLKGNKAYQCLGGIEKYLIEKKETVAVIMENNPQDAWEKLRERRVK